MTLAGLRSQLSAAEPDDSTYFGIGPAEIPLLEQLLQDREAWLAARAVFAASRIADPRAIALLQRAARDPREEVRIAVAAAVRRVTTTEANPLLLSLLDDQDLGVRKFAIKSVSTAHAPAVLQKVREMQERDPAPAIRDHAATRLKQLNVQP